MFHLPHPLIPIRQRLTVRPGVFALLAALVVALAIGGCGLLPEVEDKTANLSAERLYKLAHEALVEGNYTQAIKHFDTLEARYPYGRYAQQAILESAYANYRAGESATAVAACDRFIRTFPNHPNVDYAHYLKGLVNFREDLGLLGYVYELDLSEREPKGMRESFAAFKELVTKFPESRYAQDATERMKYLTNALGRYEAVAHLLTREAEDVFDEVGLVGIEDARFLGVLDEKQEFLDGMDQRPACRLEAGPPDDRIAGPVNQVDERPASGGEHQ